MPAAISHLIYQTPLGAVDSNLQTRFIGSGANVQESIAAAARREIPRGHTNTTTVDGSGAGSNLFATAAMRLFGIRLSALIQFYLLFVGLSVVAFVWRFRDERLFVVPFYFLVATIMLITPLSNSPEGVDQMPIGGERYFVMAPFLPALHIFFEIIDSEGTGHRPYASNALALFIQGLLLFAAFLARSATAYLLGPLIILLLWRVYRDRKERDKLASLAYKAAVVAAAFACWAAFVIVALPTYVETGRVLGIFWHRAFISFDSHPDWPFGDLRKVYDCTKQIPQGLTPHLGDQTGHCVWWSYPPNADRSQSDAFQHFYDREYEKILRNAYFYVVAHYPRQSFELYFFVKSQAIGQTIIEAWNFLFRLVHASVTKRLFMVVAAQIILFTAFVGAMAFTFSRIVDRRMIIFPIFFVFALPPRYVAFAGWTTGADLIFLMYSCLVLAVLLMLQTLTQIINRGQQMRRQRSSDSKP